MHVFAKRDGCLLEDELGCTQRSSKLRLMYLVDMKACCPNLKGSLNHPSDNNSDCVYLVTTLLPSPAERSQGNPRRGRRGDDEEEAVAPPTGPATLFDFLQPKLGKGNRGKWFYSVLMLWSHWHTLTKTNNLEHILKKGAVS